MINVSKTFRNMTQLLDDILVISVLILAALGPDLKAFRQLISSKWEKKKEKVYLGPIFDSDFHLWALRLCWMLKPDLPLPHWKDNQAGGEGRREIPCGKQKTRSQISSLIHSGRCFLIPRRELWVPDLPVNTFFKISTWSNSILDK